MAEIDFSSATIEAGGTQHPAYVGYLGINTNYFRDENNNNIGSVWSSYVKTVDEPKKFVMTYSGKMGSVPQGVEREDFYLYNVYPARKVKIGNVKFVDEDTVELKITVNLVCNEGSST